MNLEGAVSQSLFLCDGGVFFGVQKWFVGEGDLGEVLQEAGRRW
jgi:hypothetical protein